MQWIVSTNPFLWNWGVQNFDERSEGVERKTDCFDLIQGKKLEAFLSSWNLTNRPCYYLSCCYFTAPVGHGENSVARTSPE
jgi:hypothetical protein